MRDTACNILWLLITFVLNIHVWSSFLKFVQKSKRDLLNVVNSKVNFAMLKSIFVPPLICSLMKVDMEKSQLGTSKSLLHWQRPMRKADVEKRSQKKKPEKSRLLPRSNDFSRVCRSCFPPHSALLSRKEFNQTTLRIESTRTKLNRIACSCRGENFSWRMKRHPREIFDKFERK